jgi:isopentenyl-diphosphate delta-isomerase
VDLFEKRKQDHIELSLQDRVQAYGQSGLDAVQLYHEALPEFDFSEVNTATRILGHDFQFPYLISSMTAGHQSGVRINQILAEAASERSWLMAVGSQRRELTDVVAATEWKNIRQQAPNLKLIGNIGIAQAIVSSTAQIQALVDSLQAVALFIHCNPLQEVLQPEGNTEFRGGLKAIERLVREISVPVLVKEVGCGFSPGTLQRLENIGVPVVDVSGRGGTHWGRLEAYRSAPESVLYQVGHTFKDWGETTLDSLTNAKKILKNTDVWASGGVRSGLDAAKLFALGASVVGFAQPLIKAIVEGTPAKDDTSNGDNESSHQISDNHRGGNQSRNKESRNNQSGNKQSGDRATDAESALRHKMEVLEMELKIAMFCSGSMTIQELKEKVNDGSKFRL